MLFEDQVRIDQGRGHRINNGIEVWGDFMRIVHIPTGIFRIAEPPLGKTVSEKKQRMLNEIEEELKEKGLMEYIKDPEI